MSEILDARRLALVLRADAYGWYRTLLLIAATVAGLVLLGALYARGGGDAAAAAALFADSYYFGWFALTLFAWGFILSSRSFRDLHDSNHNTAFLLLPASSLEKTLARLLLTTAGFALFLLAFMTLVSWLAEGVNVLLSRNVRPTFRPLDASVWTLVAHYVVLQSLFFLGGSWFRKNHLFKTLLALIAIGLAVIGFALIVNRIVLAPYVGRELSVVVDGMTHEFYTAHRPLFDAVAIAGQLAYFVALPLFCWTVAWLRVKETQVSDGI